MTYDPVHKQLIIVGGYNGSTSQTGMQLVDQVTVGSSSVPVPDTWTAQRVPVSGSPGTYCYNWTQVTTIGNSSSNAPPGSGLAHMIATYIPSTGYDTGYYSTYNDLCSNVGPDQSQPGVGAGGVYFDIDRSQLGANENLLLNLTFIPLGQSNNAPNSTAMTESDEAIFFIHLVHTGQSASQLQSLTQPRYLTYSDTTTYPEVVPKLAVVSEPSGQPRTEQILIPLNSNPNIDRIRIERNSGTAILVSASLFRMGQK